MVHIPPRVAFPYRITKQHTLLLALLVAMNLTMVCGGHLHEGHLSSVHLAIFGEPHIHLDDTDSDSDPQAQPESHAETNDTSADHADHAAHYSSNTFPISPRDAGATWVSSSGGELSLLSMLGVALFLDAWYATGNGAWIRLLTSTRSIHIAGAPEPPPPRAFPCFACASRHLILST